MDTLKLLAMLELDIKHWSGEALREAYNFCIERTATMENHDAEYAWWWHRTETLRQEITDRGGRR